MASLVNSVKHLKNNLLHFSKKWRERNTSKFILWGHIILIPKADSTSLKKLQTNIPREYWCKNPQMMTHWIQQLIKRIMYHDKVSFISINMGMVEYNQINQIIYTINRMKGKNTIWSSQVMQKKHLTQHPSMIKRLNKLGIGHFSLW